MKHYSIISFLLFAVSSQTTGQNIFCTRIGGPSSDYGCSIIQTADGGYVAVGETESFGAGNHDMFFSKTDSAGILIWSKTFGTSDSEGACDIQADANGDLAIIGYHTNNYFQIYPFFLKVDNATGNFISSKKYDGFYSQHPLTRPMEQFRLIKTASGYLFYDRGDNIFSILNNNFDLQYSKTIDSILIKQIIQTQDGGLAIIGCRVAINGIDSAMDVVKIDSAANFQWAYTYGGCEGKSLIQLNNGNYLIIGSYYNGNSYSDNYLFYLNSNGQPIWTKDSFGGEAIKLINTSDDGIVMEMYDGSTYMKLIKIDTIPFLQWAKTINSTGRGRSIIETLDNGFCAIASSTNQGGGNADMKLIKVDDAGTSCCFLPLNISFGNPPISMSPRIRIVSDTVLSSSFSSIGTMGIHGTPTIICSVTDLQGFAETNDFIIFPNPNNGLFTIQCKNDFQNAWIDIYNLMGENKFSTTVNKNDELIRVNNVVSGIYVIKIFQESKITTRKLIIE
jgi:hypothetical protein